MDGMTLLEKLQTSDDSDTISFHHVDAEGKWSADGCNYTVAELRTIIDKATKYDAMFATRQVNTPCLPDHNS